MSRLGNVAPVVRSKKLRDSARGQACALQIHPHCNQDPATVVLCHISSERKGIGIKSDDFFAVYGCSTCHDIIDNRRYVDITPAEINQCVLRGLYRTWLAMIDAGLISIEGAKQ